MNSELAPSVDAPLPGQSLGGGRWLMRLAGAAVHRGLNPAWFGYRYTRRETLAQHLARHGSDSAYPATSQILHPPAVAHNPLPCNITSREQLPADRGWWGYSFHDVPQRPTGQTTIATLNDCRITWYHDAEQANDFYPAIITGDGRAMDLREVRFRPRHAQELRRARPPRRLRRATWFVERVYHNHSHWLTAHLPKLLLLRDRRGLGEVLLPRQRTRTIDESLELLGMDLSQFIEFDFDRPLRVEQLTVLETDRFRPELLQLVPQALGISEAPRRYRRVFISRAGAARRRLLNEEQLWALLEPAGFERVRMEELTFAQQVELMRQTAVLCAPHGAGLTNMMFCPAGTQVIEMADLSFPNPNFYALACAMRHRYWLLPAKAIGDQHPLERDLHGDIEALQQVLPQLQDSCAGAR